MTEIITRFVNSIHPRLQLPLASYTQRLGTKPDGLWYGIGDSWVSWVRESCPALAEKNMFPVHLFPEKILRISTEEELQKFSDEMSVYIAGRKMHDIDWSKVATLYSGIEISAEAIKFSSTYLWLEDWSTASGCVWDQAAIVPNEQIIKIIRNQGSGRE